MVTQTSCRATCLIVLGLLSAASASWAQAKPAKPVLPAAIAKAFHESYPAATILAFSRERDNGRTIYEVESQDGPTRRDLVYSRTGQTLEIEETVPASGLPAAVQAALANTAPGAAVSRAERVTRGGVVPFELAVRVGGTARSRVFDLAGKAVKP